MRRLGTVKNCTLDIDLSDVPKEMFKTKARKSDRALYKALTFKLIVRIEGARLVFSFECGGQEYGAVNAEY